MRRPQRASASPQQPQIVFHASNLGALWHFIPLTVIVQHPNATPFARLALLAHAQQHTAGHNVGRHQIGAAEQGAQQAGHLAERLLAELIAAQAAEQPAKASHPQIGDLAVQRRLGRPGVVVAVATLAVALRAERIKDDRQPEQDERKHHPVEDDDGCGRCFAEEEFALLNGI